MEAALKQALGISAVLVKGDRGIFEVRADGALVFSKKECGDRFPTADEIIGLLRGRRGGPSDPPQVP